MPNFSREEMETIVHDLNNVRQIQIISEKKIESIEARFKEKLKRKKLKEEKNEGSWP